MAYEDKSLACKDCSKDFVWTAGEQEFYAQKGFSNPPSRCPDCRKQNKEKRANRQRYDITCKNCGKKDQVPFQPRYPDNVLCAECFAAARQNQKPGDEKPADESAPIEEEEKPAEKE